MLPAVSGGAHGSFSRFSTDQGDDSGWSGHRRTGVGYRLAVELKLAARAQLDDVSANAHRSDRRVFACSPRITSWRSASAAEAASRTRPLRLRHAETSFGPCETATTPRKAAHASLRW